MRSANFIFSLLCLTMGALTLHALPREQQFGAGAVSSSMAGVGIAGPDNGASTYLNPANLAFCRAAGVGVGFRYLSTNFDTKYKAGTNKGEDQLGDILAADISACVVPFEGLGIGLWGSGAGSQPLTIGLTTLNDELSFIRFDKNLQAPALMAGVSYAFLPQIAVGLSLSLTMDAHIDQTVVAPLTESIRPFSADIGAKIKPRIGVVGGVSVRPFDDLSVGATFRTADFSALDVDASTAGSAFNVAIPIIVHLQGVMNYSPRQYGLGVRYQPLSDLTLFADVNYDIWSSYKGPFLSVAADQNSALSSSIPMPPNETFTFKDVFVPKIGVAYQVLPWLALRGGYGYQPAIIGTPKNTTNLVDGDTHSFSLGTGYTYEGERTTFRCDLFALASVMPRRSVTKNAPSEAMVYNFGGYALATGLSAGVDF